MPDPLFFLAGWAHAKFILDGNGQCWLAESMIRPFLAGIRAAPDRDQAKRAAAQGRGGMGAGSDGIAPATTGPVCANVAWPIRQKIPGI
jgi:hypothetical protein